MLSSGTGQQVSLVYQQFPSYGQQGSDRVGQLAFEPWGEWPAADLGPGLPLFSDGNFQDLAPAPGDHFALAGADAHGTFVATAVTPGQPLSGEDHMAWGAPLFIARGDGDFLVGFENDAPYYGDGGLYRLRFARAPGPATQVQALRHSGCGAERVYADAVRAAGHYVVALTSGRDVGGCVDFGGGDPTRIQLVDLDDKNAITVMPEPPAQGVVSALQMVPRSDGAWLVWQVDNSIMAARLDPQGNLVTLPNRFASLPADTPFALDRLGDDLALAFTEGDPSNPRIRVEIFDSDSVGTPQADTTVVPDPATEKFVDWQLTGQLAILGAPSGEQLLVSWGSETYPATAVIVTRRLDCVHAK